MKVEFDLNGLEAREKEDAKRKRKGLAEAATSKPCEGESKGKGGGSEDDDSRKELHHHYSRPQK